MKVGDLVKYVFDIKIEFGIVVKAFNKKRTMEHPWVYVLWSDGKIERAAEHYLEVINESR